MKILLDSEFATVSFIENLSLIKVVWKDTKLTLENYKKTFTVALDFQNDNVVVNYISDIRKQRVMSPSFRKWFQETAVPQAVKQGLKRGVVIFSGNVFKKYYLNHIMNTTKKFGLPFKFFSNEDEAIEWIKSFNE